MKTGIHILSLIVLALALSALANIIHPRKIAWIKDWDNLVINIANENKIRLSSLEETIQISQEQTHTIFDARSPEDFETGHIPGAYSFYVEEFESLFPERIESLMVNDSILTYCAGITCDEAVMLAIYLKEQGYTNVSVFIEGWESWQENEKSMQKEHKNEKNI